jgi:hypothetical protein
MSGIITDQDDLFQDWQDGYGSVTAPAGSGGRRTGQYQNRYISEAWKRRASISLPSSCRPIFAIALFVIGV